MKKSWHKPFTIVLFLLVISCAATATYFSLDDSQIVHSSAFVTGNAMYGSGYFIPSSSSLLEVSLLRIFPAGNVTEISKSKIKNIQKFPVQFTLRYDTAELDENSSYRIDAVFTNSGSEARRSSITVKDLESSPVNITLR